MLLNNVFALTIQFTYYNVRKVKVILSLRLINSAPSHEDVWESEAIAPFMSLGHGT
jgi:hypothetical protein